MCTVALRNIEQLPHWIKFMSVGRNARLWMLNGTRWKFPEEPFIEFGPEDIAWARVLGFGHEMPLRINFTSLGFLHESIKSTEQHLAQTTRNYNTESSNHE